MIITFYMDIIYFFSIVISHVCRERSVTSMFHPTKDVPICCLLLVVSHSNILYKDKYFPSSSDRVLSKANSKNYSTPSSYVGLMQLAFIQLSYKYLFLDFTKFQHHFSLISKYTTWKAITLIAPQSSMHPENKAKYTIPKFHQI